MTLVSRIYAPEPAAASYRLAALVDGLSRAGAAVRVLTATPPHGMTVADPPGVRVSRAPVLRDRTGYLRGYVPYMSFDLPALVRMLRDPRPDVYVCEPPPTTGAVLRLAAALRRRPYVYYAADIWGDATAGTGAPRAVVAAVRALERWAMTGAARVIAVSEAVATRLNELGVRHVTVVRNGIDTGVFTPEEPDEDIDVAPAGDAAVAADDVDGVRRSRPYVLYAGTASEWQGSDVFLRALPRVLAEVPGARLVMLGHGSDWERLGEIAAALPPGAVELRSPVPPQEAATWQRGAVAALASVRPGAGYDLAYPTKTYAAWASGTPVIYAGPGAARADIETYDLGWAVEHDAGAVARAMIEAFTGARVFEAQRLAAWAREHVSAEAAGQRAADVVLAQARR